MENKCYDISLVIEELNKKIEKLTDKGYNIIVPKNGLEDYCGNSIMHIGYEGGIMGGAYIVLNDEEEILLKECFGDILDDIANMIESGDYKIEH